MTHPPYLVGISGGSGSGKTYFLKKLLEALGPERVCLISQDNYYRPLAQQPRDEQGIENFDLPQSIDDQAYTADIQALCRGQEVQRPEYGFNNAEATARVLVLPPRPVIVVEGLFVFYFPEIANLLNLKIFIDANDMVKIRRRILRDNVERGYGLDDVLYRYENHVLPAFERYIAPLKRDVDFIIPNHRDNQQVEKAVAVITAFLKTKL
ncbi:MAG: uridine kinase [Bernardetiaceae bacterium]|nr:uridine kinase [Bernardetiaceae bacterium]